MRPREKRVRQIQEEIGRILMERWDPIGVRGIPEASGEYDGYVGGVYRLLANRAGAEEIARHLRHIEVDRMGLGSKPGHLERLEPVARALREVEVRLGEVGDFGGMTVNERLVAAGLLEEWERAAGGRDREAMVLLLVWTDLPRESAEATVDAVLGDPGKYGPS